MFCVGVERLEGVELMDFRVGRQRQVGPFVIRKHFMIKLSILILCNSKAS